MLVEKVDRPQPSLQTHRGSMAVPRKLAVSLGSNSTLSCDPSYDKHGLSLLELQEDPLSKKAVMRHFIVIREGDCKAVSGRPDKSEVCR